MMCPKCGSRKTKRVMQYVMAPHVKLVWICSECKSEWDY